MSLPNYSLAPVILIRDKQVGIPDTLFSEVSRAVRSEVKGRLLRGEFFRSSLFSDPAWDILLDLFAAELKGLRMKVTAIGRTSDVKPTTVLRWLNVLEAEGLIYREPDRYDARRVFVGLSNEGSALMTCYFRRRLDGHTDSIPYAA